MSKQKLLTQKKLKEVLLYESSTGVFVWTKPSKFHRSLVGKPAGTVVTSNGKRYISIGINGVYHRAHRLAWLYVYGIVPEMIDHVNGDSLDNRISNLKECDYAMNNQNSKRKKKPNGLPLGVRATPKGRFQARISVNKRKLHLGTFDTAELASKAYLSARNKYHYFPASGGSL